MQTNIRRYRVLSCLSVAIALLAATPVVAQKAAAFDKLRMERDLSIMEITLDRLLSGEQREPFFRGFRERVRGLYLPDVGAIFLISDVSRLSGSVISIGRGKSEREAEQRVEVFTRSSGEAFDSEIDREKVLQPIYEFLENYADAIGQLEPEHRVIVLLQIENMFLLGPEGYAISFPRWQDEGARGFSVVAHKKDIMQFRTGKISQQQFRKRLQIKDFASARKEKTDLRIMASILEAGLKNRGHDAFSVTGDVRYLLLDDVGAMFFFDAAYAKMKDLNILYRVGAYKKSLEARRRELEVIQERVKKTGAAAKKKQDSQKQQDETLKAWQYYTYHDTTGRAARKQAFARFKNDLCDYMLDYGRTLRHLEPDQWLIFAAAIPGVEEDIPRGLVFQVKKSVLEAYDRREIPRDRALQQIKILEYQE